METKLNFKLAILTFINLFILNKCGTEEDKTQKVISCISLIQDQFHHETPRSNTFYQLLSTCYLKISSSQIKRIKEQGVQSLKSKEMLDLTNVNFLRKYPENELKSITEELEKMVINGNLFTEPDYSKDRDNDDDNDIDNNEENKKKEDDKENKKGDDKVNEKEKEKEKDKGNDDLDDFKFDDSEFKFDDSEFKYDDDMYDDYYNNGEYNFDDELNYDDMYGDPYGDDNYVDDSIGNDYDEKFANRVVIIFMAVVFLALMIYLIYLLSDTLKDPSEINKNKKQEEKEEDVEEEKAVLNKDKKE